MYKVTWVEQGKMFAEECLGFGEGLIFARNVRSNGGNAVEIWERKAIV